MKNDSFISKPHQNFLNHVEVPESDPDDCWEWKGRHVMSQEGLIAAIGLHPGAPVVAAYKRAYELFNGPIPDGMVIRHSCGNPNCVNPDHLKLISIEAAESENKRNARQARAGKGGILQQSLLARPSMAKMRNRIAAGVQAKPVPNRQGYRTVTTIRAGQHQYLRFED